MGFLFSMSGGTHIKLFIQWPMIELISNQLTIGEMHGQSK